MKWGFVGLKKCKIVSFVKIGMFKNRNVSFIFNFFL